MNGVRRKAMTNGLTEDIVKLSLSHIFLLTCCWFYYGNIRKKEKKNVKCELQIMRKTKRK